MVASAKEMAAEILSANGIDIDWISRALAPRSDQDIITEIDSIAIGTGQVGENVRCTLRWAGSSTATPADIRPNSIVLKLPSLDAASRAAAAATRTYEREVGFYRDAASKVALRIPAIYFIEEDRLNNTFALAMEDIHPAAQGEQLIGCTPQQARLAVEAAAQLHGSTWNASWVTDLDWVDTYDKGQLEQRAGLVANLFPGFMDRYQDQMTEDERATCNWFHDNIKAYLYAAGGSDVTALVHGDFRLDNMLFGQPPAPPLTVVDWQTASAGPPMTDVAYFVGTSVEPSNQAEMVEPLLRLYHDSLETQTISVDRSWIDHQFALRAPAGLAMAIVASQIVGQTERGDAMFLVMARGSCHLIDVTSTKTLIS